MSKKMGRPRIHTTDEDRVKANRLKMDLRYGLTLEYASLGKADRRPFIVGLIHDGATDEEICARTGLAVVTVQNARRAAEPPPPEVEESEAGIRLDDGAYMALVYRLNVAPPPSWRFRRDRITAPGAASGGPVSVRRRLVVDEGESYRPTP